MAIRISEEKTQFRHVSTQDPCKKIKNPMTLPSHTLTPTKAITVNPKAMASLATVATAQPAATIKGLGGSYLAGTKLFVKPSRQSFRPKSTRAGAVVAKYGEKSVYFDLEDLANTTGQWDLYGSDAPSPYNPLQSKFFETFAAPFTKRGLLLKFLLLGGGSLLAYVSATATGDVLPIKKGPQEKPQLGPRGKL